MDPVPGPLFVGKFNSSFSLIVYNGSVYVTFIQNFKNGISSLIFKCHDISQRWHEL